MVWSSRLFIFEMNSKQVTPSPMSHSAAEPFRDGKPDQAEVCLSVSNFRETTPQMRV